MSARVRRPPQRFKPEPPSARAAARLPRTSTGAPSALGACAACAACAARNHALEHTDHAPLDSAFELLQRELNRALDLSRRLERAVKAAAALGIDVDDAAHAPHAPHLRAGGALG